MEMDVSSQKQYTLTLKLSEEELEYLICSLGENGKPMPTFMRDKILATIDEYKTLPSQASR